MSGCSRNVCIPDLPNLFQFGKQYWRIGETHSQRGMYHTVSYDYRDRLLQGSIHLRPVLHEKLPYMPVLHSPGRVPEGENQSPRNLCIRNRYDLLGLQEGGGSGVSFLLYYCMIAKLQHFYNASVTQYDTLHRENICLKSLACSSSLKASPTFTCSSYSSHNIHIYLILDDSWERKSQ